MLYGCCFSFDWESWKSFVDYIIKEGWENGYDYSDWGKEISRKPSWEFLYKKQYPLLKNCLDFDIEVWKDIKLNDYNPESYAE